MELNKSLAQRSRKDSPEGARTELDNPGDNADASTASWTVEDVGKRSKKLHDVSKRVRKRSEQKSRTNSPKKAQDELHDPGSEMVVPDDPHNIQKARRTSTSMKQSHYVEIWNQESIWARRPSRKSSRATWTTQRLSTMLGMMGNIPGAMGVRGLVI
jgi:hypothetical protein